MYDTNWNYDEIQCWKGRRVCSTNVDCDFLKKKAHDQKVNKRVPALSEHSSPTFRANYHVLEF